MIRSFPPHPNPLPCLRRSGFAQAGPRGEGRPFIPPAELRGILAYFDKMNYPAASSGVSKTTTGKILRPKGRGIHPDGKITPKNLLPPCGGG